MPMGLARLETRRRAADRASQELLVRQALNGTSQSYISDALDVLRLGEHVQRSNIFQFKDIVGAQNVQVSGQSRRMARHVEHLGGAVLPE